MIIKRGGRIVAFVEADTEDEGRAILENAVASVRASLDSSGD